MLVVMVLNLLAFDLSFTFTYRLLLFVVYKDIEGRTVVYLQCIFSMN